MHPITLSPTSIALFTDCPRCFWLDKVRGISPPGSPFPSLPSGMDRVLKEHFDRHRKDRVLPAELEGRFNGHLFQDMEKLKIWRNNFKGLKYMDKTGFSLRGAIDDLFVTSDGKHAPLDFKTRGFPRKDDTHEYYQHQMDIYSFLLEKNGLKPASYAILIFYHPLKVGERHEVEFFPDPVRVDVDRARANRLFHGAVKCLQGPEPALNRDCGMCMWNRE